MRRAAPPLLSALRKTIIISQNSPRSALPAPLTFYSSRTLASTSTANSRLNLQIEQAFKSATTTDEILSAFKRMESAFGEDDKRLGLACLNVGQHLDSVGSSDHDDILSFASRALKILDRGSDSDVTIVKALILMGSVMFNLKRFDECFGYLNRADRILDVISEAVPGDLDIKSLRHTVQHKLGKMKTGVGRRAEAVEHLRKCLELKESILEMGDVRLGVMNRELAEALSGVLDFKEALLSCLKALEIHESGLGHGSVEVGRDRRLLSTIYCALGEHRRALEQIVLCQKVFDDLGLVADLNDAGIIEANIQIASGKFEEAMNTLGEVVKKMDKESLPRAMVFIAMAKALCKMERLSDTKRCLEIACDILEAKELVVPARVAEAYAEAALLYEAMNDFEAELSILKRGVAILEGLPQEWQLQGTLEGRVGFVFLHMGKVPQAVPYLESALEKLKESFGPKQLAVGYAYKNLGVAYLELDRAQSAVQMLLAAKENITASVGPLHVETIDTCQNLASAYNAMGSHDLALKSQERVIDAWESHGPDAEDEVREAQRILYQMKKKAQRKSK